MTDLGSYLPAIEVEWDRLEDEIQTGTERPQALRAFGRRLAMRDIPFPAADVYALSQEKRLTDLVGRPMPVAGISQCVREGYAERPEPVAIVPGAPPVQKLEVDSRLVDPEFGQWQSLLRMKAGRILAVPANVMTILERDSNFRGRIWWDEHAERVMTRKLPFGATGPWDSFKASGLKLWLERVYHITAPSLEDSVRWVAKEHAWNPVQTYLDTLEWDGRARIHNWLSRLMGVVDEEYTSKVGKAVLLDSVRRAFGTEVEGVLVLSDVTHPAQRVNGLKALFGAENVGRIPPTDETHVVWCQPVVENTCPHNRRNPKTTIIRVGRTPLYGDTTFWAVRTNEINVEKIKAEADQLWAEAVAEVKAGRTVNPGRARREVTLPDGVHPDFAKKIMDAADRLGRDGRSFTPAAVLKDLRVAAFGQRAQALQQKVRLTLEQHGWIQERAKWRSPFVEPESRGSRTHDE